ncbi:unnamed protein product [Ectocarpus sp. CCAP 1310/34]|nr:unnamed protein product [Ectocarpus sp. CCAP 1310/34]
MWAFYRNESDQCAAKLSALHDASASLRHQLHRKLGGMGGVREDFSSAAAAGGSGVGYEGGGSKSSAVGDDPGGTAATTASLLDDPDLQYSSSPVVSTGGVLRPTPQEHFLVAGSGAGGSGSSSGGGSSGGSGSSSSGSLSGATRIRGRRSSSNGMGGTAPSSSQQQQGEDENGWGSSGWGMSSSAPSGPSVGSGVGGDVDGGAAKANAGFGGGNGFLSNSGGAGAGDDESATTEDPYVRASLKRAIVELYDTCHRLLSFKMLNYDAFVRLMELHCRRPEVAGAPPRPPWSAGKMTVVGDHQGAKAGGAVGGEGEGALSKEKAMKVWLLEQPLFSARDLNSTLAGAELLYASLFCNGDVDVARTALTFKASSSLRGNRRFDFGYRLGAATVLLAWAMWDCIADDSLGKDVWHDPAFKIYRGLGNLVLLVYMWGVNIWVWRRFGIDYERCLSLDPKGPRVDPCEQVWNTGCNLSIAFLVSFICFYKCLRGVLLNPTWVPIQFAHTFPLLLLFYMLLCFLTPWHERKGLLRVLWTTIISPFGQVRFLEGYVGDILTSVVRVLIDVAFAFLYFLSGVRGWLGNGLDLSNDPISSDPWFQNLLVPLLMVAPLWWRFQQNLRRSYETRQRWPHLGNALKYATAMSVSLFGTFQPQMKSSWVWVFCFVFATLYQFSWDVVMDWDLLRWDGKSLRLRPRLLYRNKTLYTSVAVVNLLLRFLWTVTLVPENAPNLFPHDFQIYLSPFIAAAEIVRRLPMSNSSAHPSLGHAATYRPLAPLREGRTMWGFIRVENEHLRIYDGGGSSDGSLSPGLDAGPGAAGGFQHIASCSSMSTMASSSINSNISSSIVGGGSGLGVPMMGGGGLGGSRGSGLDKLPYSRMEMPSSSGGGIGLFRRATSPLRAWCLIRVRES